MGLCPSTPDVTGLEPVTQLAQATVPHQVRSEGLSRHQEPSGSSSRSETGSGTTTSSGTTEPSELTQASSLDTDALYDEWINDYACVLANNTLYNLSRYGKKQYTLNIHGEKQEKPNAITQEFLDNLIVYRLDEKEKPYGNQGRTSGLRYRDRYSTIAKPGKFSETKIRHKVLCSGALNKWLAPDGNEWTLGLNEKWKAFEYIKWHQKTNTEWVRYNNSLHLIHHRKHQPDKANLFWKGKFWNFACKVDQEKSEACLCSKEEVGTQLFQNNDVMWNSMVQWRFRNKRGLKRNDWSNFNIPCTKRPHTHFGPGRTKLNLMADWKVRQKWIQQFYAGNYGLVEDDRFEYRVLSPFQDLTYFSIEGKAQLYALTEKQFGEFQLMGLFYRRVRENETISKYRVRISFPGDWKLPRVRRGRLRARRTRARSTKNAPIPTDQSESSNTDEPVGSLYDIITDTDEVVEIPYKHVRDTPYHELIKNVEPQKVNPSGTDGSRPFEIHGHLLETAGASPSGTDGTSPLETDGANPTREDGVTPSECNPAAATRFAETRHEDEIAVGGRLKSIAEDGYDPNEQKQDPQPSTI